MVIEDIINICLSLDFDVWGNRVNISNMFSSKQDSHIYNFHSRKTCYLLAKKKRPVIKETS